MDYERSAGGVLLPNSGISVGGRFRLEHVRRGELIDVIEDKNLVVNEGLNHALNALFHGATQIATWYVGLFEGNYTPVATVAAATIAAAATECTAYDETTRQEFNEAAASGQSITNSANKATFTMNDDKTIYGAFLASSSVKGGTSGTLFSAAKFASAKTVTAGDQLLLTYTLSAASA